MLTLFVFQRVPTRLDIFFYFQIFFPSNNLFIFKQWVGKAMLTTSFWPPRCVLDFICQQLPLPPYSYCKTITESAESCNLRPWRQHLGSLRRLRGHRGGAQVHRHQLRQHERPPHVRTHRRWNKVGVALKWYYSLVSYYNYIFLDICSFPPRTVSCVERRGPGKDFVRIISQNDGR